MSYRKQRYRFTHSICLVSWLLLWLIPGKELQQYPPGQWDVIIENQDFTTPLNLDQGDDNILIIDSTFHDIHGDALTLRNVSNVYIKNCVIYSINGNGIVLRSTGKTDQVTIDGCTIHDTTRNGIIAKQNYSDGTDHSHLVIKNNTLYNNGSDKLDHSIYVQTQDTNIIHNEIHGSTGNGISIRSSGIVSANKIWDTSKSCIRYFGDNLRGPSNTLLIENNVCYQTLPGSRSPAFSLLWSDNASPSWVVDHYFIRFNTIVLFTEQRVGIAVESMQFEDKSVMVYGNSVINTQNISATIRQDYIDYLSSNYVSTSLEGFADLQTRPYDFKLTSLSPAVDYANKEANFPSLDINGVTRSAGHLDAGAYQLEREISSTGSTYSFARFWRLLNLQAVSSLPSEILIGIGILILVGAGIYIFRKGHTA